MAYGAEIEIKSPDCQTTVLLRGDKDAISIVHTASDAGVSLEATIELTEGTSALNALQYLRHATSSGNADSIAPLRLSKITSRSRYPMRYLSSVIRQAGEWLIKSA